MSNRRFQSKGENLRSLIGNNIISLHENIYYFISYEYSNNRNWTSSDLRFFNRAEFKSFHEIQFSMFLTISCDKEIWIEWRNLSVLFNVTNVSEGDRVDSRSSCQDAEEVKLNSCSMFSVFWLRTHQRRSFLLSMHQTFNEGHSLSNLEGQFTDRKSSTTVTYRRIEQSNMTL